MKERQRIVAVLFYFLKSLIFMKHEKDILNKKILLPRNWLSFTEDFWDLLHCLRTKKNFENIIFIGNISFLFPTEISKSWNENYHF